MFSHPPLPGLFSCLGLLFAQVEHHLVQTHYANTGNLDYQRVNNVIAHLLSEATSTLEREGYDGAHRSIEFSADARYVGQEYALTVPLRAHKLTPTLVEGLIDEFQQEHEKSYGYRSEEEVQIVALRCLARGLSDTPRVPQHLKVDAVKGWNPSPSRQAYFGPLRGWIETPVMGRSDLAARPVEGPAIIEEDNSLTVVLPDWKTSLDEWSNIVLERR